MNTSRTMAVAMLIAGSGLALYLTHSPLQSGIDHADLPGHEAAAASSRRRPLAHLIRETVTVAADQPIPSVPGKRLVSLIVDYPPGASSAAHRHARSAFIYAYVLSGEIRSQVDSEPARVYRPGELWFESPGAHHRVSANTSDTEPARLLAVFIVDAADEQLTTTGPSVNRTGRKDTYHVAADELQRGLAGRDEGSRSRLCICSPVGAPFAACRSRVPARIPDQRMRLLHRPAFARPAQGRTACGPPRSGGRMARSRRHIR